MGLLKNLYFDFSGVTSIFTRFRPANKAKRLQPTMEKISNPGEPSPYGKELPGLAQGLKRETVLESAKPMEKHAAPTELPKLFPRYEKELPKLTQYTPAPAIKSIASQDPAQISTPNPNSFFSYLLNHIDKEDKLIHDNASKDMVFSNLFSEMKGFWEEKRVAFDRDVMSSDVKDELKGKLIELRELETEWQRLQAKYDKTKEELEDKEKVIDVKILELKRAFIRVHFEQNVAPDKAFRLSNGGMLYNLADLLSSLKNMDNPVFSSHVNAGKNDFATWIKDVMGLSELSLMLYNAKTLDEHIKVISRFYSS
jgi:hypothetical protein